MNNVNKLIKVGYNKKGNFCLMYNCTVNRSDIPSGFFTHDKPAGSSTKLTAGTAKFLQMLGKSEVNDYFTKTVVYNEKITNEETFKTALTMMIGEKAEEVFASVKTLSPVKGETSLIDLDLEMTPEFGVSVVRTTVPSIYEDHKVVNPTNQETLKYMDLELYEDVTFSYGENSFIFDKEAVHVWSGQEVAAETV